MTGKNHSEALKLSWSDARHIERETGEKISNKRRGQLLALAYQKADIEAALTGEKHV